MDLVIQARQWEGAHTTLSKHLPMDERLSKALNELWPKVKQLWGSLEAFRKEKRHFLIFEYRHRRWRWFGWWGRATGTQGLMWALHQTASCASTWPQPGENHSLSDPHNYFGTRLPLPGRLQLTFSARNIPVFPKIKLCPHHIREVWAPVDPKDLTAQGNIYPRLSSLRISFTSDPPELLFSHPMTFLPSPCFCADTWEHRVEGQQMGLAISAIA